MTAADDSGRVYDARSLEVAAELPRYHDWLMADFRPHLKGAVIEVGAGIGTVAKEYVDDAKSSLLVEPAPNLHAQLAERFKGRPDVRTVCGVLDEVVKHGVDGVPVEPESFDAAIMVNVLEHIDDDYQVVTQLRTLLKPGGHLLIFVPATPLLYGAMDRAVGHVRRYTRGSLNEVMTRCGFEVETLRYFDLLGMAPWFVMGRLLNRAAVGSGSAQFYDQFIVPLCEVADTVTRAPVGKNLICVARKP